VRAYKFLDNQFGLKSLSERRLKIARISELNDPFELTPFDLSNQNDRWAFHATRDELSLRFGLVCFSAEWKNPVIWAHYSDKHRGLCLGFEIPEEVEKTRTKRVEYISKPEPFPRNLASLSSEQQFGVIQTMLYKKYASWAYEREIRTWTTLEDEEDGLCYMNFGEMLPLAEVIIGARCTTSKSTIMGTLGDVASQVTINNARPSYNAFQMEAGGD
jgi:hypothetical protein